MKRKHNLKVGDTIEFANLMEVQIWSEKHDLSNDKFECISDGKPYVYKRIK